MIDNLSIAAPRLNEVYFGITFNRWDIAAEECELVNCYLKLKQLHIKVLEKVKKR